PYRRPTAAPPRRSSVSALNVTLVAADGKVWDGEATKVTVPADEGPMGILPSHAPVLASLGHGEVHITGTDKTSFTADCDGGFVTVDDNIVTIAVDTATITTRR
ncbi:F0F1 ATP synthase subunit epsilon, partial [Dermatophilus congolensis]|uniref:F0F1 ATP synthase subunit epsilon n=1 Tax=Dermatophilus congolensis TaxID=1863 RepID=UPI001FBACFF8